MRPVSWSLSLGHVTKQPRHRQCRSLRYAITRDATARPALRVARVGRELGGLGRNGPGAGTKCRRCADCADERGRTDAAADDFGAGRRNGASIGLQGRPVVAGEAHRAAAQHPFYDRDGDPPADGRSRGDDRTRGFAQCSRHQPCGREGSSQGDSLTIRGFTARSDIFLDGMRDFGSYYRDPFYLQDIQVLKGPASILFGRGSTGGVVEQDSKLPTLNPFTNGTLVFGTDMTKRARADVNQPLPDLGTGAALRLNVMANQNGITD